MKRLPILPALAAMSLFVTVAAAEDGGPQPFELIRTLQKIQDEIVHGSRKAHRIQPSVLRHTTRRFDRFDPKVWSDRRNAKAAVIFTLSGGHPRVSQRILRAGTLHKSYTKLMKAALAVSQRNKRQALRYFKKIDPLKLPGHLGGLFALVHGVLLTQDKPEEASRLFALSGLLAPGTIIEEAALRRNLIVTSELKKPAAFFRTSSNYIRRFENSIFNKSFDKLLTTQALTFGDQLLSSNIADLDELLQKMSPHRRRALYVTLARGAVSRAMLDVTKFAADRALAASKPGTESFVQARLYKAGAEVVSEDLAGITKVLSGLNPKKLSEEDRQLVAKIKKVGAMLVQWPPPVNAPGKVPAASEPKAEAPSPLLARAETVFKSVDAILE